MEPGEVQESPQGRAGRGCRSHLAKIDSLKSGSVRHILSRVLVTEARTHCEMGVVHIRSALGRFRWHKEAT